MGFALLLLGLMPLMMMGDMFTGGEDAEPDEDPRDVGIMPDDTQSVSFFDTFETNNSAPILPDTEDEAPYEGDDVDPSTVISPDESDATPVEGDSVDPNTVLDPDGAAATDYTIGDGTTLQDLIASQSDLSAGVDWLGGQIAETADHLLGDDADTFALEQDGIVGDGEGALSDHTGTPFVDTDSTLHVIDGGGGDDVITGADSGLYAFGEAGDDTITAGEGASALFGGLGADTLIGTTDAAFMDGGDGDDMITGSDEGDTLFGGAHELTDTDVQDDDVIDGGAGDDEIYGGQGADTLMGGDGDDVINHFGSVDEVSALEERSFDWHLDGDADTLFGGTGDDTLIMDREDSATGGEGMDTFWVYFDNNGSDSFADVQDFEQGTDFLRVTLNPDLDHGDMTIDVQPSGDGQDSVVTLNGEVVAMLRGAPDATLADVLFEVTPNIYA